MPDREHSTILSEDAHEPKHITNAGTVDSGKVITPSANVEGESELRQLSTQDLSDSEGLVSSYAVISANGNASKILPSNAQEPTTILSLFSMQASSGVTLSNELLTFSVSGVYLINITIDNSGSTGQTINLSYQINQGLDSPVATFLSDSSFSHTFVVSVNENDRLDLLGISVDQETLEFRPARTISFHKVS